MVSPGLARRFRTNYFFFLTNKKSLGRFDTKTCEISHTNEKSHANSAVEFPSEYVVNTCNNCTELGQNYHSTCGSAEQVQQGDGSFVESV